MSDHLNPQEISQIISDGKEKLSLSKNKHLEKCSMCQKTFSDHQSVHTSLLKIIPINSPPGIKQEVIKRLEKMEFLVKPKNKTDWSFLFAIVTLLLIGFWIIIYGEASFVDQGIVSLKNSFPEINNLEIGIKLPEFNILNWGNYFPIKYLYMFAGLVSILLYSVMDKKLYNLYKLNKS